MSALNTQVAGSHYKDKAIQPVEYIHANGLGFLEGCIIKRITRWRAKDGVRDLQKIKHEVDLLIELEDRKAKEQQVQAAISAATAERMQQEERNRQSRELLERTARWTPPATCEEPRCVLCWGDIQCCASCK